MKRGLDKISYMVVLMAMIMFMGLRIVPHHHCVISDGAPQRTMHIGFGECEGCGHGHADDEHDSDHQHSGKHCLNDSQFFIRLYDDDVLIVKKALNLQPAIVVQKMAICFLGQNADSFSTCDTKPPQSRSVQFRALRAPPVA